jgi:hypothetical protein
MVEGYGENRMSVLKTSIAWSVVLFAALTVWIAGCSGQVATTAPASSNDQIATTAAVSCWFSLSPSNVNYAASDSMGSVIVNTTTNCSWTASSDAEWISITGSSSGHGSGTVTYHVAPNTTHSDREATIKVVEAESDSAAVLHYVNQSAATKLHLRGAYTFMLEVDPDGRCGWPETRFYVPVYVKETSFTGDTATGLIKFPAVAATPSNTWSISIYSTKIELVPGPQSSGLAGGAYKVVVDGGSWTAGALSQAPDGRGEIKGGTASGAMQTLTLHDSDERWVCQSEAKWSLIIRYTDED